MSDSSPFEDAPEEDHPTGHVEEEEEEEDDQDEEKEQPEQEDDPFADVPQASSSAHGAPSLDSQPEPQIDEETALSVWEKERGEVLRERQAAADSQKAQQVSTAKEEITKFYEDAASKLDKTKKVNRADEKNYRSDTAAIFANGTKWEKVNRLVNIAPKHGEKPGSSRVERYRKLLTSLKAEKDKKAKAKA